MSYVAKVLQPGEQVVHVGRLHWIMYLPAVIVFCIGLAVLAIPSPSDNRAIIYIISGVLLLIAALSAFRAWFKQFTTEIAVTDRRIIYKAGFISRHTAEMNMHRVETVAVEQGIIRPYDRVRNCAYPGNRCRHRKSDDDLGSFSLA
jgi:uncharacterized membrane protein YdbT with pleckstrin-like domain